MSEHVRRYWRLLERVFGVAEEPLWEKPADWEQQFEDPINDIMACCGRHVSDCDCQGRKPCPVCGNPVHPDGICIVCEWREGL